MRMLLIEGSGVVMVVVRVFLILVLIEGESWFVVVCCYSIDVSLFISLSPGAIGKASHFFYQ
jgi:hypothetical protein